MNKIIRFTLKFPNNFVNNCCNRQISIFNNKLNHDQSNSTKFTPIYKFPYIRGCSLINRIKLYQTALTAFTIPSSVILNQLNVITSEAVIFTGALGISGCIALYGTGFLFQNFVGFVYYNEENEVAKISYVDFWGRRKDIEVPVNDLVPFNELPVSPLNGLFLSLQRFSSKERLRMNLRFGIVLDKDKFKKVF